MRLKHFYIFSLSFDTLDKNLKLTKNSFSLGTTSLSSNLDFKTRFCLDSVLTTNSFWYFSDISLIFFLSKLQLTSFLFMFNHVQKILNPNVWKKLTENQLCLSANLVFSRRDLIRIQVTAGE